MKIFVATHFFPDSYPLDLHRSAQQEVVDRRADRENTRVIHEWCSR